MAQPAGEPAQLPPPAVANPDPIAGAGHCSDGDIVDLAAAALARPKAVWVSSFVLHAPLELLARAGLLPLVDPAARDQVRTGMLGIARAYTAAEQDAPPVRVQTYANAVTAVDRLGHAITSGDAEAADACAEWLARACDPTSLARSLTDLVLPRLSAAAHGNIFLYQLPRIAPRSRPAAAMIRNLVRLMAEHPSQVLTWQTSRPAAATAPPDLLPKLCRQRKVDYSGGGSIHPLMTHVETNGLAASIIGAALPGLSVEQATRDLLRVAALSMLQDDPQHAPYGWSHCLTLPQAALGIARNSADPGAAIAIAGTFVLGFRAALGAVALDPDWTPAPLAGGDPRDRMDGTPAEAAAGIWYARDAEIPPLARLLATRAATHADAHLAKYTLACLDATAADPSAGRLYLAAAAYLGAWWRRKTADR